MFKNLILFLGITSIVVLLADCQHSGDPHETLDDGGTIQITKDKNRLYCIHHHD
ncbi:hypothetical protein ACFLS9_01215 [Bacteroidota bacterium]